MTTAAVDAAMVAAAVKLLNNGAQDDSILRASLHQIAETAVETMGAAGSAVLLLDPLTPARATHASNNAAARLQHTQIELGIGPSLDARLTDTLIATNDITRHPRWAALASHLTDTSIAAVLAVPLHTGQDVVGSLTVHRLASRPWMSRDRRAMTALGQLADVTLIAAINADAGTALAGQLQTALNRRVIIERAVGVIMGRADLDNTRAFNTLRGSARSQRRTIVELAEDLLCRHVERVRSNPGSK